VTIASACAPPRSGYRAGDRSAGCSTRPRCSTDQYDLPRPRRDVRLACHARRSSRATNRVTPHRDRRADREHFSKRLPRTMMGQPGLAPQEGRPFVSLIGPRRSRTPGEESPRRASRSVRSRIAPGGRRPPRGRPEQRGGVVPGPYEGNDPGELQRILAEAVDAGRDAIQHAGARARPSPSP